MVRSDLIIAGSNFIFSHISQNYSHLLNSKKKLLVIFRGINVDYYNPDTVKESDEKKLIEKWKIDKNRSAGCMKTMQKPTKIENRSKSQCRVYEKGAKIKKIEKSIKIVVPGV